MMVNWTGCLGRTPRPSLVCLVGLLVPWGLCGSVVWRTGVWILKLSWGSYLDWVVSSGPSAQQVSCELTVHPYTTCPNLGLSREQAWSPGAQQHHWPGATAHSQLPPRQRADPAGGGTALSPGQCHHLQRLRGLSPPRPGQGEAAQFSPRVTGY